MVSFDDFSPQSGIPIYFQILDYIKRAAVAGKIKDGDELPSRRVLSALLAVNPNTVQKAYRALEEEGLMKSHAGAKSFMVINEEAVLKIRGELLMSDAKRAVASLKQMGITKSEALELIEKNWEVTE